MSNLEAANRVRNFVLLAGWFLIMIWGVYFTTPAPSPIRVKMPTETSIREGIERERVERKIKRYAASARTVYRANGCRDTYSEITGRTAYEYGLSPRLLAAVVFVESSCNPRAVSGRDSVGLLQINPRVWGRRADLKDPVQNMRIGARILKAYIDRYGVVEGLHHFNCYSEIHKHEYVNKVLTTGGLKA